MTPSANDLDFMARIAAAGGLAPSVLGGGERARAERLRSWGLVRLALLPQRYVLTPTGWLQLEHAWPPRRYCLECDAVHAQGESCGRGLGAFAPLADSGVIEKSCT